MNKLFTIILTVALMVTTSNGVAIGIDPGIPDTIKITGGPLVVGQSIPLIVTLVNDEALGAMGFPLAVSTLDSGFARYDSVVYINRMTDPMIFDYREVTVWDGDGITPDSFIFTGLAFAGYAMPTGNTSIMQYYYTGLTPGMMSLDSASKHASFMQLVDVSGMGVWTPQFEALEVEILAGYRPPVITFDTETPRMVAGSQLTFDIYAESPEGFPVTFEPIEMYGYDDETSSPINAPVLTPGDPAVLTWTSTSSDIGIWQVMVGACDSSETCTDRVFEIQVVSDSSYLIDFDITSVDGPGKTIGIIHGNYDSDAQPEFIAGAHYDPSLALYDYSTEGVWDRTTLYTNDWPKFGLHPGFFDSDDDLDAVFMLFHVPEYTLQVLLGNGDNTFTESTYENDGTFAYHLTLGEFTGDNHLDICAATYGSVYVFSGNSLGGFVESGSFDFPALSINSADFDGDGVDDLAIGKDNGLSIFLNDGSGGFTSSYFYSQDYGSLEIEVTNQGSDFDNDNIFDLCISTPSVGGQYSEMYVYLGNGDGSFTQYNIRNVKGQIFGNCVGDYNNDGDLDIAYVNGAREYAAILFGDGDGGFTNELRYTIPYDNPQFIDGFDADVDGDIDLMVAANGGDIEDHFLYYLDNQLDPPGFTQKSFGIDACNNIEIELTSANGRMLNRVKNTIPSAGFYRRNIDQDQIIDDFASLQLVEAGQYTLKAAPQPNVNPGEPFTLEFKLSDQPYRLAKNIPMNGDGYDFTLYLGETSEVLPRPGQYVYANPPSFTWLGEGHHDFQLAQNIDFTDIIIEALMVTNTVTPLEALPVTDTATYYWRIKSSAQSEYDCLYAVNILAGSASECGDANDDGDLNVGDAVYIIAYVFTGGPPPPFICQADANGDGDINIGDAVYLIIYIFNGGPPPVESCCP